MASENDSSGEVCRPAAGTEVSWCKAIPGGTGITVLALLLSKPIHIPCLHSSLQTLFTHHPILISKLSFAEDHSTPPVFIIPSSPLVTIEVQTLSLEFHEVVEVELNRNSWLEGSYEDPIPVFFVTVYGSSELSKWVLCLRFHTAACDRASSMSILKELLTLMASKEGNRDETKVDDVATKAGIEDLIPKKDSSKPFWMRGKDLLGYSINGLRSSTLQFEDTESEQKTEFIRLIFSKEETQNLLRECEGREVKLCGAISAAGLIAARNSKHLEGQSETYSVVTLVDSRKFLEPPLEKHNVGFYHSAITNTFSLTGSESIWDLTKTYQNSFTKSLSNKKHLTDISDLNFLMCKAIENPNLTASSALRTSLISVFYESILYEDYENGGELGQELELEDSVEKKLGLVDYVGCASVHGIGPCFGVFDMIRNGILDCCFVYPSPLFSRGEMEKVVDNMKSLIVGACVNVELD